jgi:hypothetical protein
MVGMLSPATKQGPILEPSGGDGAFVDSLIKAGVPASAIAVWDINPEVEAPLEAFGVEVEIGDSLLRADRKREFRGVIGNPPYLSKHSEYIRVNKGELGKIYGEIGAHDAYAMFTYLGVNALLPEGQLVFLISDTFLTLGVHRKFREWLVRETQIDSIVLLPGDTFADASVNVAILAVTRKKAAADHSIAFVDARGGAGVPEKAHKVDQATLSDVPGTLFNYEPGKRDTLNSIKALPKLIDIVDGGLGMHTGDNNRYLAVVAGRGVKARPAQETVTVDEIDGKTWRAYHKRGGSRRWYAPAEHAVRWDAASQASYGIPATARAGSVGAKPRAGVLVSGISARLTAREATLGALWESNKAFALFPKDPEKHPVEFLIAILNSQTYTDIVATLNHTVSLQVRHIKQLPLLPFSDAEIAELARLGRAAIDWVAANPTAEADPPQQADIDRLVSGAYKRGTSKAGNRSQDPQML